MKELQHAWEGEPHQKSKNPIDASSQRGTPSLDIIWQDLWQITPADWSHTKTIKDNEQWKEYQCYSCLCILCSCKDAKW